MFLYYSDMGIPTRMVRPLVYLLFAIGSSRNFSSSKRGAGFEMRPERVVSGTLVFLLLCVEPDILESCLERLCAGLLDCFRTAMEFWKGILSNFFG
jgi:hypothetical protein